MIVPLPSKFSVELRDLVRQARRLEREVRPSKRCDLRERLAGEGRSVQNVRMAEARGQWAVTMGLLVAIYVPRR